MIEVALESLLRQWDDVVGWLREYRRELIAADALEQHAESWESSDRDPDWLLPRGRLADAEALAERPEFSGRLAHTRDYLAACRAAEDQRLADEDELRRVRERARIAEALAQTEKAHRADVRRRSRILRRVLALTALVAVAAGDGFFYAANYRREAVSTARAAESTARAAESTVRAAESTVRAAESTARQAIADRLTLDAALLLNSDGPYRPEPQLPAPADKERAIQELLAANALATGPAKTSVDCYLSPPGPRCIEDSQLDPLHVAAEAGLGSTPAELCAKLTMNMSHKQFQQWVSPDIDYIELCPGLPIAPD